MNPVTIDQVETWHEALRDRDVAVIQFHWHPDHLRPFVIMWTQGETTFLAKLNVKPEYWPMLDVYGPPPTVGDPPLHLTTVWLRDDQPDWRADLNVVNTASGAIDRMVTAADKYLALCGARGGT